jgi:hypothetical protein
MTDDLAADRTRLEKVITEELFRYLRSEGSSVFQAQAALTVVAAKMLETITQLTGVPRDEVLAVHVMAMKRGFEWLDLHRASVH